MDSTAHPRLASPNVIFGLGGTLEGTISPILRQQLEREWRAWRPTYLTDDDTTETDDHPTTDDLTLEHKAPRMVK